MQKLQSISDQIFSLRSMSQRLFSELQPYSKAARGAEEPTPAPEPPVFSESVAASRAAPVTSNMAIEPSRLNFEEAPKFVANRFLTDPLLRAGLQDPELLDCLHVSGPARSLPVYIATGRSSWNSSESGTMSIAFI